LQASFVGTECTAELPTDAEADEMEEHLRALGYIE
jgi:hypothetical protein